MSQPLNVQKFLAQVLTLRRCSGFCTEPHSTLGHACSSWLPLDGAVGSPWGPRPWRVWSSWRRSPEGAFPLPPRTPPWSASLERQSMSLSCSFWFLPHRPRGQRAKEAGDLPGCRGNGEQTIGGESALLQRPHLPPKSQQPTSRHANPSF